MSYKAPISNRNPEPNNKQLLILLTMFGGILVSIILILIISINQLVNLIPVSFEQKLGTLIVDSYEKQSKPSPSQDKLNQLVDELEELLANERDYKVLYIPEDTINALAIPGDTIIVYKGLLDKIKSENELMMILGHELGHFENRDHLRGLGNVLIIRILVNYLIGDWQTLASGIDFVNIITNAQFSQKQETKADEFGLNLLNQHYGHVAGATDFFRRLKQENKAGINIDFLSTHPLPEKRIRKLNKLIKEKNYLVKEKQPLQIK